MWVVTLNFYSHYCGGCSDVAYPIYTTGSSFHCIHAHSPSPPYPLYFTLNQLIPWIVVMHPICSHYLRVGQSILSWLSLIKVSKRPTCLTCESDSVHSINLSKANLRDCIPWRNKSKCGFNPDRRFDTVYSLGHKVCRGTRLTTSRMVFLCGIVSQALAQSNIDFIGSDLSKVANLVLVGTTKLWCISWELVYFWYPLLLLKSL